MAKVIKSSHPIKKYADGGAVSGVPETSALKRAAKAGIEFLRKATQNPASKEADAAVEARRKKQKADETLMYGKPLRKK